MVQPLPCNAVAQLSLVGDDGNNTLSVAGVIAGSFGARCRRAGEHQRGRRGRNSTSSAEAPSASAFAATRARISSAAAGVTTSWASPARRTATRSSRTPQPGAHRGRQHRPLPIERFLIDGAGDDEIASAGDDDVLIGEKNRDDSLSGLGGATCSSAMLWWSAVCRPGSPGRRRGGRPSVRGLHRGGCAGRRRRRAGAGATATTSSCSAAAATTRCSRAPEPLRWTEAPAPATTSSSEDEGFDDDIVVTSTVFDDRLSGESNAIAGLEELVIQLGSGPTRSTPRPGRAATSSSATTARTP